jgi:hypothetical protein
MYCDENETVKDSEHNYNEAPRCNVSDGDMGTLVCNEVRLTRAGVFALLAEDDEEDEEEDGMEKDIGGESGDEEGEMFMFRFIFSVLI